MGKRDASSGFIINFYLKIFEFLSKLSIFYIIRKLKKNISYTFVEAWVLGNLIAAIISTVVSYYLGSKAPWLMYIIITYGMLRVFEIIVYQLNVLFFDPYHAQKRKEVYKIKSPTRMVILLLHNYVEVMFWYAAIIIALISLNTASMTCTLGEYIRSSVLCVATFNSGAIEEITGQLYPRLSNIVFFQVVTGLIMTIVSLARFIGLMPDIEYIDDPKNISDSGNELKVTVGTGKATCCKVQGPRSSEGIK